MLRTDILKIYYVNRSQHWRFIMSRRTDILDTYYANRKKKRKKRRHHWT